MAFSNQVQHGFAGFKEDLDLPAFSINTDNLFFRNSCVCADKCQPVFPIGLIDFFDIQLFTAVGILDTAAFLDHSDHIHTF